MSCKCFLKKFLMKFFFVRFKSVKVWFCFYSNVFILKGFAGCSILKVASLHGWNIFAKSNNFHYSNNNENTLLTLMYEKKWNASSAVKKIILYYDNNWFLGTTKIYLWREKQKASVAVIKQSLENRIDFSFCADNLFYLTFYHTIYCIPNFICMHVDLYKLDCRHLMGTWPVFMSFWWA